MGSPFEVRTDSSESIETAETPMIQEPDRPGKQQSKVPRSNRISMGPKETRLQALPLRSKH